MKKTLFTLALATLISTQSHAGLVDNMTDLTFDTSSFYSNKGQYGLDNCAAPEPSETSFTIRGGSVTNYCTGHVLFNEAATFDMADNFVLDFSFSNTNIYSGGPGINSKVGAFFSRAGSSNSLKTKFLGTDLTGFNTKNGDFRILKEGDLATITHISTNTSTTIDVAGNNNVYTLSQFYYSGSYSSATLSNISYATQATDVNSPFAIGTLSLLGLATIRRMRSKK